MAQYTNMFNKLSVYYTHILAIFIVASFFLFFIESSLAADRITLKGVQIKSHKGTFVVTKDVSIRSLPTTKSKRLGSFKTGKRIQSVGFADGLWVAIRRKNQDVGFVYGKFLLPLIDGTLSKNLKGKASSRKKLSKKCQYTISFEGKSSVEGQFFKIADYDILWECMTDKKSIKFRTPMFITEAPYKLSQKRIFQITVDVIDQDHGYDEILSTFILFDEEKGFVFYDGISIKKYGYKIAAKKIPATSLAEALKGAALIAIKSWNKGVWRDLIKNMPKYPDPISRKSGSKMKKDNK